MFDFPLVFFFCLFAFSSCRPTFCSFEMHLYLGSWREIACFWPSFFQQLKKKKIRFLFVGACFGGVADKVGKKVLENSEGGKEVIVGFFPAGVRRKARNQGEAEYRGWEKRERRSRKLDRVTWSRGKSCRRRVVRKTLSRRRRRRRRIRMQEKKTDEEEKNSGLFLVSVTVR